MRVFYGGERAFEAIVSNSIPTHDMQQYFQQEYQRLIDASQSHSIPQVAQGFIDNVKNLYEYVQGSDAMRIAKAALAQASYMFQHDCIRTLSTLEELQNAPSTMQRWIMAEPTIRELHNKQSCAGYSDTYVDKYPDTIGQSHYDYRRVTNYLVQDSEDAFFCVNYCEDLEGQDKELLIHEKAQIINTWELVKLYALEADRDPTSIWNSKF